MLKISPRFKEYISVNLNKTSGHLKTTSVSLPLPVSACLTAVLPPPLLSQ